MAAVGGKDVFFVISTIIITVYSICGIRITKLNAHTHKYLSSSLKNKQKT